jgi:hypothetical protein
MKNLKNISLELSKDIRENSWLCTQISLIIDGSFDTEMLYKEIISLYDINKPNRGKGNNNLKARVGNVVIQKLYDINLNQALSVWKFLSNEDKKELDSLVIDNIDYLMSEM